MKLESSATFLSRFLVGDGLFAKPRKIKCTVHMEVLFKDLVLLFTESIKTFRKQMETFKRATCTSGLSDKDNVKGKKFSIICIHYKNEKKTKKKKKVTTILGKMAKIEI